MNTNKLHRTRKLLSLAAALVFPVCAYADAAPAPHSNGNDQVMPASSEGEEAIARFKVTPGLKVSLFAAEPDLANPVAFNCDNKGNWYVVETFRRRQGVMDIRGIMSWLDDDLACTSVEDRLAMHHKHMGDAFKELSVYSDKVRFIQDTDGDGKADKSTEFAGGFGNPEDGIAAGIVERKGNVWLTDIPHLWLLKDTNGDGKADIKKSLLYGFGVRVGFLGHDLHGPRFGPDGKLYMSIGDRAFNVMTEHGRVSNLESGSVMRCNPDGTEFEIFATGLRNPQQLCFDEYGNLFSGDNNCDHGDPARWVNIVEGSDNGWRVGYQHMVNAGPWNAEKIHALPDRNDCASIVPPVAHIGSGPSGVAHYPGTGLPERFNGHFWMVDFRGGASNSGIHCFALQPRGAGFSMTDHSQFIWNILPTDVRFGPDGGVYLIDWVGGWSVTGKGRIYKVYDEALSKSPLVLQTKQLLADGMEKRPAEELARLLSHPDQRVRQDAQFELADRGAGSIATFANVLKTSRETLPRIHAIWGLGQLAGKNPEAMTVVASALGDSDGEVRAQAAKVAGEHHFASAAGALVKDLADSSPRVEFFAAIALGKLKAEEAVAPLAEVLRRNDNKDAWLRHAAVMGLVGCAKTADLEQLRSDSSAAVRMGSLLALRRMQNRAVGEFLHDSDAWVVLEAARAINDAPVYAALPELAKMADQKGLDARVLKRVIAANYRLGGAEQAEALARIAQRGDVPNDARADALNLLAAWEHPSGRDHVVGLWRPITSVRDEKAVAAAVGPILDRLARDRANPVRVAAVKLIEQLGGHQEVLWELASAPRLGAEVKAAALQAMAAQKHPKLDEALRLCLADNRAAVRKAAITLMAKSSQAILTLQSMLKSASVADQQAVYNAISGIDTPLVDQILSEGLDKLSSGKLPKEVELDVMDAASKAKTNAIREKLQRYEASLPKNDDLAPYRPALYGGDAANGKKIFFQRADAQCTRCHLAGNKNESGQPMAGPDLTGIGSKKDRTYFLESILFPNKQVAQGYEGIQLKLKSGKGVVGVLKSEDATTLSIEIPEKGIRKVNKADVASRERGPSPMPEGFDKILSKRDMRDLVEFLTSLK